MSWRDVEARALAATLHDLAAFGPKHVGTPAGARAADYLCTRFQQIGLTNVHLERFAFPRHEVSAAHLDLMLGDTALLPACAALEGCGGGVVAASLVYVGDATADRLAALDLRGRIALVDRNPLYHRSTQYQGVAAAGAVAMLVISTAPANLLQVGSVRRAWEAMGPIPALALGALDGGRVRAALVAGQPVSAHITVSASVMRGVGQNVIGMLPGESAHALVIGAHYDSWFAGSSDNGAGVAALLALATRWAQQPPPRYTLVFVAWDGEEVALYGGYDFLRRHAVIGRAPLLAVIDFETPSAHGAQAYGLACSGHAPLSDAIHGVGLHELYALDLPMDLVPELFGGIIPTDVQGLYRSGVPTVSTAVDAPYYHTIEDTPDKVDLDRLVQMVDGFDRALGRFMAEPIARFATRDPALWSLDVELRRGDGEVLVLVEVRDGTGRARGDAAIEAVLFADHFFAVATTTARSGSDGRATLRFGASEWDGCTAPRFVHVSAGDRHPLAERVLYDG